MHTAAKRILFWAPRVSCILFAAFLSLFSLDVFGEGYGLGETVLALLLHLLPVFLVILVLIVAWRWEWIGAALFVALALSGVGEGCLSKAPAFRSLGRPRVLTG